MLSQTEEGINRNILECKYVYQSLKQSQCVCINRNILECKFKKRLYKQVTVIVLIETYWNVNSFLIAEDFI